MIERQWIAYRIGVEEGMRAYAYWADGQEFVGTSGKTLREAIDLFRKDGYPARTPESLDGAITERINDAKAASECSVAACTSLATTLCADCGDQRCAECVSPDGRCEFCEEERG